MIAQHCFGGSFGFISRLAKLDTFLLIVFDESSLTATSGVNLCFDDRDRTAKFIVRFRGFIARSGYAVFEYFYAEFFEELFALIFVDFHETFDSNLNCKPRIIVVVKNDGQRDSSDWIAMKLRLSLKFGNLVGIFDTIGAQYTSVRTESIMYRSLHVEGSHSLLL